MCGGVVSRDRYKLENKYWQELPDKGHYCLWVEHDNVPAEWLNIMSESVCASGSRNSNRKAVLLLL